MQLIHVALESGSEENADRFYEDLLGLEKQAPKRLSGPLSRQIFQLSSDVELGVINYMDRQLHFEIFIDSGHVVDRKRISHVCIDVGDLGGFLERCSEMGVAVRRIPKGDKVVTFVEDFDGNLFEITGGKA